MKYKSSIILLVIFSINGCQLDTLKLEHVINPGATPPPPLKPANILESTLLTNDMDQIAIIENSNITFDCANHILHQGMEIRSKLIDGNWLPTTNVTVKNCTSLSTIRVYGIARNGESSNLTTSSKQAGHTERVQAAAPRNIRLENINVKLSDAGPIGFYLAPGVTHSEIVNSSISGTASSTSIYLDAESANNRIIGNRITTETTKREQIAIDGSANNQIIGNHFSNLKNGGIYLYRNCGEAGNTRHQTPSYNLITENTFLHDKSTVSQPDIWLASRNGFRTYCYFDDNVPYGSGISNLDHATHNIVEKNIFINAMEIKVDAEPNTIRNNQKQ